jgi:hypothetical protein
MEIVDFRLLIEKPMLASAGRFGAHGIARRELAWNSSAIFAGLRLCSEILSLPAFWVGRWMLLISSF